MVNIDPSLAQLACRNHPLASLAHLPCRRVGPTVVDSKAYRNKAVGNSMVVSKYYLVRNT